MDWRSDDISWRSSLISSARRGATAVEDDRKQLHSQLTWTYTAAIQRGIMCSVTLSTPTTWFLQILEIVKTSLHYIHLRAIGITFIVSQGVVNVVADEVLLLR